MIYIGTVRIVQKVAKETTKGVKYQLKAEDMDGNKITPHRRSERLQDIQHRRRHRPHQEHPVANHHEAST